MAGQFSTYMANKMLDKVLRGDDFVVGPSYWVGLFKAVSDVSLRANSAATSSEVSSGLGYQRIEVRGATGLTFGGSSGGLSALGGALAWAAATGGWGTVTYAAIMDSATLNAGNVILFGPLTTPKVVDVGDLFRIELGSLSIQL